MEANATASTTVPAAFLRTSMRGAVSETRWLVPFSWQLVGKAKWQFGVALEERAATKNPTRLVYTSVVLPPEGMVQPTGKVQFHTLPAEPVRNSSFQPARSMPAPPTSSMNSLVEPEVLTSLIRTSLRLVAVAPAGNV